MTSNATITMTMETRCESRPRKNIGTVHVASCRTTLHGRNRKMMAWVVFYNRVTFTADGSRAAASLLAREALWNVTNDRKDYIFGAILTSSDEQLHLFSIARDGRQSEEICGTLDSFWSSDDIKCDHLDDHLKTGGERI